MSRLATNLELYDHEDWWTDFTAIVRGTIAAAPDTVETPCYLYAFQYAEERNAVTVLVKYRRATLRDL